MACCGGIAVELSALGEIDLPAAIFDQATDRLLLVGGGIARKNGAVGVATDHGSINGGKDLPPGDLDSLGVLVQLIP